MPTLIIKLHTLLFLFIKFQFFFCFNSKKIRVLKIFQASTTFLLNIVNGVLVACEIVVESNNFEMN